MIKIAVCDDNTDELSNMKKLLNLYSSSRNIKYEYTVFSNGFDLVLALERGQKFSIYCLDIIMPGLNGLDLAKEIRNFDKTSPIIFFTSSTEFAIDSYSVKAINYVLKPVSQDKFFVTFDDALEQITNVADEEFIVLKSTVGIEKILVSNLVFAEVIGRNVFYHLLSGKVIECKESFAIISDTLMKYGFFMKPHRSYIVNMNYINIIGTHEISLQTLSTIPIAQGRAKEIKKQYLEYQMQEVFTTE